MFLTPVSSNCRFALVGNQLSGRIPNELRSVDDNDLRTLGLIFCTEEGAYAPPGSPMAALVALYNGDEVEYPFVGPVDPSDGIKFG